MAPPSALNTEDMSAPPGPAWQFRQTELGSDATSNRDFFPVSASASFAPCMVWQLSQDPTPPLWNEWAGRILTRSAARRKSKAAAMQTGCCFMNTLDSQLSASGRLAKLAAVCGFPSHRFFIFLCSMSAEQLVQPCMRFMLLSQSLMILKTLTPLFAAWAT